MDKKELVKKIVESAIARGGVFLEDSMLGNAVEGILDDYPVIGDANRGDWDWWGSAHADMAQFDDADGSTGTNMSAAINAYGEEWAGEGKFAVVAYAWTPSNGIDTEPLLGKAVFDYEPVRQLTIAANVNGMVDKLHDAMTNVSGVMFDPEWCKDVLSAVIEHAPITRGAISAKVKTLDVTVHSLPNGTSILCVWAGLDETNDTVVGKATFLSDKFWSILLSD